MAKPKDKSSSLKSIDLSAKNIDKLLEECQDHFIQSESYMKPLYTSFDEKESILINSPEDSLTKTTNSKIFDPRLSTIVVERGARVAAQNLKGKAYAVSKNDIGKNLIMNLLVDNARKRSNEQFSHLIKMRLLSIYSMVYGSMFALVPWRINSRTGYMGPEMNLIPIRDVFPQPGIHQVNDMDYFTVRNVVTPTFLESVDGSVWNKDDIKKFLDELKTLKPEHLTTTKTKENESYITKKYFPTQSGYGGDRVFPQIELLTEYRDGKWITWVPALADLEKSRPYIFRTVENPYPDGMLPIVAKHAFPLLDSPIGLGEFERGKTLQYAMNSLINLYMDGVKYSIFPPVHINPDNVNKESIKWGYGEFWFMNNPGRDVQMMQMSPQGLNEFNSTYGFLLSALQSQAGTTDISERSSAAPSLGKTPSAINYITQRENSRDSWEQFMLEEAMKEVYTRWTALFATKMDVDVEMRLFGDEIKEIQEQYPDASELFDSQKRGKIKVNKNMLNDKGLKDGQYTQYDYEIETGSSYKPNIEAEQQNLTAIIKAVLENPGINEALQAKGKTIAVDELFKKWIVAGGTKDWDKIIVDMAPQNPATKGLNTDQTQIQPQEMMQGMMTGGPSPSIPVEGQQGVPQEAAIPQGIDLSQLNFRDPEIMQAAQSLLGGINGIPSENFQVQ